LVHFVSYAKALILNRNTYFKTNTFFTAWLAYCCTAVSHAQSQTAVPVPVLPTVTVIAPAYKLEAHQALQASPAAIGKIFDIDLERDVSGARRLEDVLVESGLAYWDASNSLGLSTGVGFRGFALSNQGNQQLQGSRAYLNGHPDIVWRFARDPATVARVQVLQGNDATLLGAGSPGGTVQYLSKTPVGTESLRLQLGANSASGLRLSLDAEKHFGVLQVRAVLAAQRGERTLEGVLDNRSAALIATKLPWATGEVRLDIEHHTNSLPFPFGTAYAGGKFWLDQPYVDQRASAQRNYNRQALYVRQELSSTTTLNAHWQRVRSSRDETLLGFFDPLNATKLRGYYRLIKEDNAQVDMGLKVDGSNSLAVFPASDKSGALTHRWTVAYSTSSQNRAFSGPQNIGGFTLDLANPLFPANLAVLTLSPRFVFESYRERGLGASSVWQLNNLELRVGLRRSAIEIDSATNPNLPQVRVADSAQNTASVGLGYAMPDSQRLWLSFAESIQPNRGTLSGGAYLPPSLGRQRELGWERTWAGDNQSGKASLQAFDVLQSNLPRRDPRDPDAFVLIGAVRSTGISAALDLQKGPFAFKTALTQQHARVLNVSAVSTAQGNELIGVPARFGSASVSVKSSVGLWALQAQGASSLAGDASASFRASGYVVYGLRWQAPLAADTKHQLQWGARLDNALDRRYVRALTGADNVWQGQRRKLTVWAEVPF
jgi:outer membrane receptor protein involved in Fe transport